MQFGSFSETQSLERFHFFIHMTARVHSIRPYLGQIEMQDYTGYGGHDPIMTSDHPIKNRPHRVKAAITRLELFSLG
jgi:hypothetical protein